MAFNPKQEYLVISKDYNIEEFHRYTDEFITRPPYQRKTVWSKEKKQSLMDSLFRRYYVPKLVIREVRISDDKTIHEIVDGQQRITTVQSFFNNEYSLPTSLNDIHPNLGGKYYKDLSSELRRFIDREIKFTADIVKSIDDPKNNEHQKIATEIFWRLQQGETLNFMEIAHAKLSSLSRNVIVKYSDDITFDYEKYLPIDENPNKHTFFKMLNKSNKRMDHLKFLSRFLILEEANDYIDLKDKNVNDFVERYIKEDGVGNNDLENEKFVKNTISVLNLIVEIFKNDPMISDDNKVIKELSVEYFIISFYLLVRHLKNNYAIGEAEKETIRHFFYSFYQRWWRNDATDNDIMAFSNNRQQSIVNLQTRDRIIRQLFFEYLTENNIDFKLKDEQRAFNEAQRIEIYRRDKGLCQECLEEGKNEKEAIVSWNDYQADHIFPHSKGGQTEIENGQLLCTFHNQKKSNKITISNNM